MPTYQYRCTECGHDLEVVQKFSDAALTECPSCHGQLRKVFNAVGVVFKGSGFYRTDSRAKEGSADKGSTAEKSEAAASTGGNGKEAGKDAAPKADAKPGSASGSKDSKTSGSGNGSSSSASSSASSSSSTGSSSTS